ncbi:isochorismatase family protein [Polluticoccus soli]|uniref:isochorismatase family protein n=1 Tax=Polluticoccus soli TaxID=3034150 RepID=UPI0023E321E5|nr:isochorismatase family protein [Flavipsychrobacter sp. JY13-12]
MSSYPVRDVANDHLLTPANTTLLIIDYQPVQVNSINSMPRKQLVSNIGIVAELAMAFKIPVVLSTVNVATGINKETIPSLKNILQNIPSIDRTTINAWEDQQFYEAVMATGRKKLLMTALWTEACLTFPTLDAIKEGFEVYPIVDAVGGTSVLAHETALRRVEQGGARLISIAQLACELQRDWNRHDTAEHMVKALTEVGAFLKL